jgi:hypothetical protein
MGMGKIKSFHDFVFESRLSENVNLWDEERELSRGEKAALSRDFQIISNEQMAAIYLRALGMEEGDPGKYLVMIPGIDQFGEKNPETGMFEISVPAFADAIGMDSTETARRTTKKLRNLLAGKDDPAESISPKYLESFKNFQKETPSYLANYASGCIQETSYTKNRDKAETNLEKAAENRVAKKKKDAQIGYKVLQLSRELKRNPAFSEPDKALRAAVNKIAVETGIQSDKIKGIYMEYLRREKISS